MPRKIDVFYSIAQIEKRFLPNAYAKRAEREEQEKLAGMTPEEQAHYVGNKMAQETLKGICRAMKKRCA
ncbi:MAG: hypothetical protein V1887_04400 [Candidatus Aenigmatarchaeota archaeon]